MPAMILGSVLTADSLPESTEILITMGLSIISFAIMTALAFLVTKLLGVRDGHRGVFRFMLTFGNVGFIGFPVLSAIFGPSTLIYGSIFNLPFNFLVFTMGVWFIAQDSGRGAKVKMGLKTFLTPANIACAIAIVLTLLNVHSVPIIGDAAETLGSFTTPGALLIIGSSLADLPVSKLIGGPRLWIASFARLIISPLIVWALFRLVPVDPMLIDIMVVLCAMPVATNGTMLCYQYGGDSRTMAQEPSSPPCCRRHDTDSRHGHRVEDEAREGEAVPPRFRAQGISVLKQSSLRCGTARGTRPAPERLATPELTLPRHGGRGPSECGSTVPRPRWEGSPHRPAACPRAKTCAGAGTSSRPRCDRGFPARRGKRPRNPEAVRSKRESLTRSTRAR